MVGPTLTSQFGAQIAQVKWVVVLYLLVITCLLLPMGKLSDLWGRRRVYLIGFATFTAGSLLCGMAPHLLELLGARIIQGLGAAMLMANGPAVITAIFSENERGKALGMLSMVVSAGLVSGPALGGILVSTIGWRSIFLVNIPVGILGFYLCKKQIPSTVPKLKNAPFDYWGAILQFLVLLNFILLVSPAGSLGESGVSITFPRWSLLVSLVGLICAFVLQEKKSASPVIDFSLFRIRAFASGNLAAFFLFVGYATCAVLMPFFLEGILKLAPRDAGVLMTAIPVVIFGVAPLAGRWSDRVGSMGLGIAGALITALALVGLGGAFGGGLRQQVQVHEIVFWLASIGFALGIFQAPNNNAIMSSVPLQKLGVASALLATIRNLGLVTGTGLAVALFTWRQSLGDSFDHAIRFAFLVGGLSCLMALFASAAKGRKFQR